MWKGVPEGGRQKSSGMIASGWTGRDASNMEEGSENVMWRDARPGGKRKVDQRDSFEPTGMRCIKHGPRIGKCNVEGCTKMGQTKVEQEDGFGLAGARCVKHGGEI